MSLKHGSNAMTYIIKRPYWSPHNVFSFHDFNVRFSQVTHYIQLFIFSNVHFARNVVTFYHRQNLTICFMSPQCCVFCIKIWQYKGTCLAFSLVLNRVMKLQVSKTRKSCFLSTEYSYIKGENSEEKLYFLLRLVLS